MWKDLLKTIIGPALAFLYTVLISAYPDFPLSSEQFVGLILWILGIALGGWSAAKWHSKKQK